MPITKGCKRNGKLCLNCGRTHPDATGDKNGIKKGRKCPWMIGDKNVSKRLEVRRKIRIAKRGKPNYKIRGKRNGLVKHPDKNPMKRLEVRAKISGDKNCMRNPEIAKKCFESKLTNKPYIYNDIHFMSIQEIECYKFLKHLKINFKYNFRVNGGFIDFFINNKLFWEHHPPQPIFNNDEQETYEKYYQRRRTVLNNNGYKNTPLIVTTDLNQLPKIKEFLDRQG